MPFQSSWLTQATLYKYRYIVGYALLFVLLTFVLTIDIRTLPGGINEREMATAVTSSQVGSLTNLEWIVNAPFHAFQFALIWLFGLSKLTLVLPSLVFGAATMVLFILTMQHWFKPNVAIITSIVAVTNVAFVTMARSGTADIMFSFWTILLLFASVKLLMEYEKSFGWKVLITVAAAGLLYTPFGIYTLGAFAISGMLHPHIRSRIRKIKRRRLLILAALAAVLLLPLGYALVRQPSVIASLTGFDTFTQAFVHPLDNLRSLFNYYANFLHGRLEDGRILPTFGIVTIILAALGLFQAFKDRHTARSYALLTWTGVTAVLILLVPFEQRIVLMPTMLLLAIGIHTLIYDWYKLFPRNPYARIAGLIPLSILFIGVGYSNLTHYFSTMRYNTSPEYTYSLPAIKDALRPIADQPAYLIVRPEDLAFYMLIQHSFPRTSVLTEPHESDVRYTTLIVPGANNTFTQPPSEIITSYTVKNEVVLRIYRP